MRNSPTWATEVGDPRYNGLWQVDTRAEIERRHAHTREVLKRVDSIPRDALPEDDKLNFDLFRRNTAMEIEGSQFPGELLPLTQMGGVYSEGAETLRINPKATRKDFGDMLQRIDGIPERVDEDIALMREGLEKGITPPRILLREVPKLIENEITESPTSSPIFTVVFKTMPDSISTTEAAAMKDRATSSITNGVFPAYRKLLAFERDEYEPKARDTIGLSALPNGAAWYAHRIRSVTTTDKSPEEIHGIGLREVARIRGEMDQLRIKAGFTTASMDEFFTYLRTDPQFFYKDAKSLLAGYRDIAKRIDPELPKLFGKLPRLTYGVVPVPDYLEKTQPSAYMWPGSYEAGRPGLFFANTYDLMSRPTWAMEALTLHEAVPGHHLQISLAQELMNIPKFRRYGGYTAYVEGWGLYSESLGKQIGLYEDVYSDFGRLTFEIWRAVRLVVDTGIHAKGWTRDQAINYFKENAPRSQHEIEAEVDRYIAWPAQALAYKLGELKIKELREHARHELGDRFDTRAFHDKVLDAGALPLSLLEARIKQWVAAEKASKAK